MDFSLGFCLFACLFFVFVFLSIGLNSGRGPVGPWLEPSLSEGWSGRGREGGCAGPRPAWGLSDFCLQRRAM